MPTNYITQTLGLLTVPAFIFVIWYGIKRKNRPTKIIAWAILQLFLWPLFLPLYLVFNWRHKKNGNLPINDTERKINVEKIIGAIAPFGAVGLNIFTATLFEPGLGSLIFIPLMLLGFIAIPFSITGMLTSGKTSQTMFDVGEIISLLSILPSLFLISTAF